MAVAGRPRGRTGPVRTVIITWGMFVQRVFSPLLSSLFFGLFFSSGQICPNIESSFQDPTHLSTAALRICCVEGRLFLSCRWSIQHFSVTYELIVPVRVRLKTEPARTCVVETKNCCTFLISLQTEARKKNPLSVLAINTAQLLSSSYDP